jgi:hypothetical protein
MSLDFSSCCQRRPLIAIPGVGGRISIDAEMLMQVDAAVLQIGGRGLDRPPTIGVAGGDIGTGDARVPNWR